MHASLRVSCSAPVSGQDVSDDRDRHEYFSVRMCKVSMASKIHAACVSAGWSLHGATYGRHESALQHAHSIRHTLAEQREALDPSRLLYQAEWQAVCTSRHAQILCLSNLCSTAFLRKCSFAQRRTSITRWKLTLCLALGYRYGAADGQYDVGNILGK